MNTYSFMAILQIDEKNLSIEKLNLSVTYVYTETQTGGFSCEPIPSSIEIQNIAAIGEVIAEHGDACDWENFLDQDEVDTLCWEDYEKRSKVC